MDTEDADKKTTNAKATRRDGEDGLCEEITMRRRALHGNETSTGINRRGREHMDDQESQQHTNDVSCLTKPRRARKMKRELRTTLVNRTRT